MENPLYDISLYSHLPAFTALIFAILLFLKKEKHGFTAKIMGVIMVFWVVITGSYLINPGDYVFLYRFDILYNSLVMIVISLHAVYFSYLTQNRLRLRTAVYLFAPALIATICLIISYALAGEENAILFIRNYLIEAQLPTPDDWHYRILTTTYNFVNPLIIIESVAVMIYIYHSLKKYDKRLEDYYSNIDDKNKPDNYFVFYATLLLLAVNVVYTLIVVIDSSSERFILNMGLTISAVIFFLIGRSVMRNNFSAADMEYELAKDTQKEEIYKENNTKESIQNSLEVLDIRLQYLLEKEQLYLHSDLTLDNLATRLYTNRSYLSQLFNQVYGVHFFDYINALRVRHAENLLADSENGLSLEEIYIKSGFSAKSSFYRIFKQINNCTPSEFRKNLQNKNTF
jgi:AraC-like DNA-binding protein